MGPEVQARSSSSLCTYSCSHHTRHASFHNDVCAVLPHLRFPRNPSATTGDSAGAISLAPDRVRNGPRPPLLAEARVAGHRLRECAMSPGTRHPESRLAGCQCRRTERSSSLAGPRCGPDPSLVPHSHLVAALIPCAVLPDRPTVAVRLPRPSPRHRVKAVRGRAQAWGGRRMSRTRRTCSTRRLDRAPTAALCVVPTRVSHGERDLRAVGPHDVACLGGEVEVMLLKARLVDNTIRWAQPVAITTTVVRSDGLCCTRRPAALPRGGAVLLFSARPSMPRIAVDGTAIKEHLLRAACDTAA